MLLNFFADEHTTSPEVSEVTWDEVVDWLTDHERTPCGPVCISAKCPHKGGINYNFAELRAGGTRSIAHVVAVHAAVLDLDHVAPSDLPALRARLQGLDAVISSSHRPRPEAPRLRLVIRLSRPVLREEWPAFWDRLTQWLGVEVDKAARDACHFFYRPSAPEGAPVYFWCSTGAPLEVGPFLGPLGAPLSPPPVDLGTLRARLQRVAEGSRPSAPFVARLLRGEPLAPHGQRHAAWVRVLGVVADVADPDAPIEALLSLCTESRAAEIEETPEADHPWEALEAMLDSARASRAGREEAKNAAKVRMEAALKRLAKSPRTEPEDAPKAKNETEDTPETEEWPLIFADEVAAVTAMNERFALFEKPGQVCAVDVVGGVLRQWDHANLGHLLGPYRVSVGEKQSRLSTVWWSSAGARRVQKIITSSGDTPPGAFNLWRGFSVVPREGPTHRMHDLLLALAGGSQTDADYLEQWCAWCVQHPTELAETAVLLKGEEGCGKSTLAELMVAYFGVHGHTVQRQEDLTGRFNDMLCSACFVAAEEVFCTDKRASEVLKSLVTARSLRIEGKNQQAFSAPNILKLILTTNRNQALHVPTRGRRYFEAECLPYHSRGTPEDDAWWADFYAWLDAGGREAWLAELLTLDLSGFNIRAAPRTSALQADRLASQDPVVLWWLDVLQEGAGSPTGGIGQGFGAALRLVSAEGLEVEAKSLLESHVLWCREQRLPPLTGNALGRILSNFGGQRRKSGKDRNRKWYWPSLDFAWENLAQKIEIPVEILRA